MFEELALSISTLVFLLCTFLVNSLVPSPPSQPSEPIAPVSAHVIKQQESSVLLGKWKCGEKSIEFKESGKLIYDAVEMLYETNGKQLIVKQGDGDKMRTHTLSIEPIDENKIKINGVTLYRMDR